jgi:pimeloyl-ACP methyl ester carboxylesterase
VNPSSLILIPGILCDSTVWLPQAAALRDIADVHIAELIECDSLGLMAEAILKTAPASFALAGHSVGGRVALEILRRAPQRIEKLALLDTGYEALAPGPAGEREAAGRQRMVAKARERGDARNGPGMGAGNAASAAAVGRSTGRKHPRHDRT